LKDRSFVIPVLDFSPASKFNIKTLLDDLEEIEGEVIIVFNSKEVAEEIKNHRRIDFYAILNCNVGVPRAWNIGLDISRTDVTFILNSDLNVRKEAIENLEKFLKSTYDAAIVAPQGSYHNYFAHKDHMYFGKMALKKPTAVDAISGFFFAVKTGLFNNKILKFESKYTPCYFEEWDMGLQVKLAGLKSYVVPTDGYEHEWGGSIRALSFIEYYDRKINRDEIHLRNSKIFENKWNKIFEEESKKGYSELLVSYWADMKIAQVNELLSENNILEAKKNCEELITVYPIYKWGYYILGKIYQFENNVKGAKSNFLDAVKLDANFTEAKIELEKLS